MADAILQAPMAQMALLPGMRIVLEAISPTTGNTVAGVVISDVAIEGTNEGGFAAGGFPGATNEALSWLPVPVQ